MKHVLLAATLLLGLTVSCSSPKPPTAAPVPTASPAIIHIYDSPSPKNKPLPLIFIDGRTSSNANLKLLAPSSVANVTILNAANGASVYGKRGRYGVIIVTTKKGGE